jgi:hypothetical protein
VVDWRHSKSRLKPEQGDCPPKRDNFFHKILAERELFFPSDPHSLPKRKYLSVLTNRADGMRGNETLLSIRSPTATAVQGKPPDVSIPRPQPKSEGGSGLSAAAFMPSHSTKGAK